MWKIAAIVALALGVTRPALAEAPKRKAPSVTYTAATLTPADTIIVHDGVKKSLKDPGSARFGGHAAGISADGTILVCGLVNARNSYGGYTGDQPYSGLLLTTKSGRRVFIPVKIGGDRNDREAVVKVCRSDGLDPF